MKDYNFNAIEPVIRRFRVFDRRTGKFLPQYDKAWALRADGKLTRHGKPVQWAVIVPASGFVDSRGKMLYRYDTFGDGEYMIDYHKNEWGVWDMYGEVTFLPMHIYFNPPYSENKYVLGCIKKGNALEPFSQFLKTYLDSKDSISSSENIHQLQEAGNGR